LSPDSQVGVSKFPKLGFMRLWGPIILCANLRLRSSLKKSCSPYREFSNNMWHVTYTQGNRSNSWLLVVGNQIVNLTLDPSFGHNLCFKCPNVSYKPILDIYIPRDFQWYKELFDPMGLALAIVLWKFGSPSRLQLPKCELIWECGGSFPHTLPHSQEYEMWLPAFTFGPHLRKPLP